MDERPIIYLIDDDFIYQSITGMLVERIFKPLDFVSFNNGQEALDLIKENQDVKESLPNLILLDINMPIMNGWDFLNELSDMLPHLAKKPKISMMSSSSLEEDVNKAMKYPSVVEFVTKPLTLDHLQKLTEDF